MRPAARVCALTHENCNVGAIWLIQSDSLRSEDARLTLSVNVDSQETAGVIFHVCACASGAPAARTPASMIIGLRYAPAAKETRARGDRLPAPAALARPVARVITIVGADVGSLGLVQYHQHDLAAFDRGERLRDRVL